MPIATAIDACSKAIMECPGYVPSDASAGGFTGTGGAQGTGGRSDVDACIANLPRDASHDATKPDAGKDR